MKIISLTAENLKRLRAVEIRPNGNTIVVGGRNGAGKSSVLDAIMYAFVGKGAVCPRPVREGEKRASVEVDLGDLKVRRTFTPEGGGTLTVSAADGARYPSPQAVLDGLVGRLSFDPLDFARQKPEQQAVTLRALTGLDFSAQDAERKRLYDQRTEVGRQIKALDGQIAGLPHHADAPTEEVDAAALTAELDEIAAHNTAQEKIRETARAAARQAEERAAAVGRYDQEIARLEAQIAALRKERTAAHAGAEIARENARGAAEVAEAAQDRDAEPTKVQLRALGETNRKVRDNAARVQKHTERETQAAWQQRLTDAIGAIDAAKRVALAEAPFPLPGLGFSEDGGVTMDGLPFEQASAAQQLRASVAIGLGLNPKLRVLLVRDGSLLDHDNLAMVAQMAADADAQVWIERVGDGAEVSVLIEDGEVAL